MKNDILKENIKSIERRLNCMRPMMAWEELNSSSAKRDRIGLIFTCVNSMAGVRRNGFFGNTEAVKDAILRSDMFANQRKMLIDEYVDVLYFLNKRFFFVFLEKHPLIKSSPSREMHLDDNTRRGLSMRLMNDNLAVFLMTYCNFSTHVGKQRLKMLFKPLSLYFVLSL
jgi:hypothetical protein